MMTKIRCMSAAQVGERYRLDPDGYLLTDMMGFPVAVEADDAPQIASWPVARVVKVGAYWSNQPEGTSGYYVEFICLTR